jgi:hypothetical protein
MKVSLDLRSTVGAVRVPVLHWPQLRGRTVLGGYTAVGSRRGLTLRPDGRNPSYFFHRQPKRPADFLDRPF